MLCEVKGACEIEGICLKVSYHLCVKLMDEGMDPDRSNEIMVRMEYALANGGNTQSPKPKTPADKKQVSPEVSEVLHMLDALQAIGRKPGSDDH